MHTQCENWLIYIEEEWKERRKKRGKINAIHSNFLFPNITKVQWQIATRPAFCHTWTIFSHWQYTVLRSFFKKKFFEEKTLKHCSVELEAQWYMNQILHALSSVCSLQSQKNLRTDIIVCGLTEIEFVDFYGLSVHLSSHFLPWMCNSSPKLDTQIHVSIPPSRLPFE